MKNTLILFVLVMNVFSVFAQTLTVSVPVVTVPVGQHVYIPVKLSGASASGVPISSANIQITYDTAVLFCDSVTNFYSGTPVNQWFYTGANGLVSANWLEPSLLTVPIPDNTTLFQIKFTKKSAGNSPLTFIVSEFTDAAYNLIPTNPANGAVNAPLVYRQVTFRVDMSKENITSSGVHLAGSFNNWSPTANPMALGANSIYTATLSLVEGQNYTYRFVNGNISAGMENVPSQCGMLNTTGVYERSLMIPATDTSLSTVCFSLCTACPLTVNVTFRVDMQHKNVSPMGVHVAGGFNNWNYSQSLMNNTSGTIYEFTQQMTEGTTQEFLFVNGITAGDAENIPALCASNGHRYFIIPSHDTTLTAFCFDSCFACNAVPKYSNITFRVDLSNLDSISVNGVHLAGSFQGWDPATTPMTGQADSIYTYTAAFLAGTQLEYRFVNGNNASGFELVPIGCSSLSGNRTIIVPDYDTTLMAVCFSACDSCGPVLGIDPGPESQHLQVGQNNPNPCSTNTRVQFQIPSPGMCRIDVLDLNGQQVLESWENYLPGGNHSATLLVGSLKPGIYLYRMLFTGHITESITRKLVIIR